MLLKKKLKLQLQIIVKIAYKQKFLNDLLLKSFKTNTYVPAKIRLSYGLFLTKNLNKYNYFSSYQNKLCLISLSNKVPNTHLMFSRFFLNNQYSKANISNVLK